ncbi:MAG: zinc-ribbon domain containing protein [Acidobacteria bacterium]|nr:zinc-ribbon domain containing protein [Acidobacteriota bacterium]
MSQIGTGRFAKTNGKVSDADEFTDKLIPCIDCESEFVWTAGEQAFYRQKELQNPPKRCKSCKQAKNRRLEAIELSKITGKKTRIDVQARCARCQQTTTIPFYPSQGRPVYCRACFIEMKGESANSYP